MRISRMKRLQLFLTVTMLSILSATTISAEENNADNGQQASQSSGVEVSARPVNLQQQDASTWDFEMTFSTHSVELGFDLLQAARLVNETGVTVVPISWTGGQGGHHLTGTLSFENKTLKGSSSVKLVISPPELGEWTFSWPLKTAENQ